MCSQKEFPMHLIKTIGSALSIAALTACGGASEPADSGFAAAKKIEDAAANAVKGIEAACRVTPARLETTKEERLNREIDAWEKYGSFTVAFQQDALVGMTMYLEQVETQTYPSDPWSSLLNFENAFGWGNVSETASEFWRQQLQNPTRLKALYALMGDDLIRRAIGKVGYDSVLAWKSDIAPLLTKRVNDRLALDYSAWHACNGTPERCGADTASAHLKPGHDRFVATFTSYYGVEPTYVQGWFAGWLIRRYAEGGDELVTAWQEVLQSAIKQVR